MCPHALPAHVDSGIAVAVGGAGPDDAFARLPGARRPRLLRGLVAVAVARLGVSVPLPSLIVPAAPPSRCDKNRSVASFDIAGHLFLSEGGLRVGSQSHGRADVLNGDALINALVPQEWAHYVVVIVFVKTAHAHLLIAACLKVSLRV